MSKDHENVQNYLRKNNPVDYRVSEYQDLRHILTLELRSCTKVSDAEPEEIIVTLIHHFHGPFKGENCSLELVDIGSTECSERILLKGSNGLEIEAWRICLSGEVLDEISDAVEGLLRLPE